MEGTFVISLDFELLWGVRDHSDRTSYGANILGARRAVPKMLQLFAENGIHATWATVGFLFCESKEELISCLPEIRPSYTNSALSNYLYLEEVGANEAIDPCYFAGSLIEKIRQTPGQEVATHTLSHYYCMEDGQTVDAFEADLRTAQQIASHRGIDIRSIVFPRNQFSSEHLDVCARLGLVSFRGNPKGWAYQASKGADQTALKRAMRLVDAYTGLQGPMTFGRSGMVPANVPASRFLRPCAGRLAAFHPLHIAVIRRGMTAAAKSGAGYHLWWHPHNFGRDLDANIDGLQHILQHFRMLQDKFNMISATMEESV